MSRRRPLQIVLLPRALEIVCTDRGQHPLRELAVLDPVVLDDDHLAQCDYRHSVTNPDDPWWTWCPDETHGFRVRGSSFPIRVVTGLDAAGNPVGPWSGKRHVKRDIESRLGPNGWTLHLPRCPSCGHTARRQVSKLALFADARDSPRAVLDVSTL